MNYLSDLAGAAFSAGAWHSLHELTLGVAEHEEARTLPQEVPPRARPSKSLARPEPQEPLNLDPPQPASASTAPNTIAIKDAPDKIRLFMTNPFYMVTSIGKEHPNLWILISYHLFTSHQNHSET